jgi:hypothetical protein
MTVSRPPDEAVQYRDVVAFLESRAAGEVPHVAQTLFEHLQGTYDLLREWGSPVYVCHAGLCHALYGTDGLAASLLDVGSERPALAAVIGGHAEALVYFYASCDRSYLYPQLGATDRPAFRDRFTGATYVPEPAVFADFMELTFANELDMFRDNAALVAEHQATWGVRFDRRQRFVTQRAFASFREVFGGPERRPA